MPFHHCICSTFYHFICTQGSAKLTVLNFQTCQVDKFSVGDIIATPFEHDRSWYRARITEILEGDQIDVYYVDFGDSCIVSMDTVKAIR